MSDGKCDSYYSLVLYVKQMWQWLMHHQSKMVLQSSMGLDSAQQKPLWIHIDVAIHEISRDNTVIFAP